MHLCRDRFIEYSVRTISKVRLVVVEEVRWDNSGMEPAEVCSF
jgi:hypothetical protein